MKPKTVAREVQLLYRFILLYSHSLISVPPYPIQSFIGLRDVRAITYCVSWEVLLAPSTY